MFFSETDQEEYQKHETHFALPFVHPRSLNVILVLGTTDHIHFWI